MTPRLWRTAFAALALAVACNEEDPGPDPALIQMIDGDEQTANVSTALPLPLRVRVLDQAGAPVMGVTVTWSLVSGGGGSITPTSTTNIDGIASAAFTLSAVVGEQQARAAVDGLAGSPVTFTATATEPGGGGGGGGGPVEVRAGGNNVPERYTSDLWLHGSFGYTGTWGFRQQQGNAIKVWQLSTTGAPALANTVVIPNVGTVSDVEVTADGQILLATTENGIADANGMHLYSLANPAAPAPLGKLAVSGGFHTGTFSTIAGKRYVFGARNPTSSTAPALVIVDVTAPAAPAVAATVPVPDDYGIHDTFVRDGIAFVFAWNTGVILYDVGNGMKGGSPSAPVEISRLVTSSSGLPDGAQVHNGWWFHNPTNGEKRYLFVGQEGPGSVGGFTSSGDIHVVDVSNLNAPVEVATFRLDGAGVHNFWMDEARQILYAAYYNGGVVALDVSGTLSGNLANRVLGSVRPAGSTTFVWGVMLHQGSLYASDMHSGLWQLSPVAEN
jgi:hypothetical protein